MCKVCKVGMVVSLILAEEESQSTSEVGVGWVKGEDGLLKVCSSHHKTPI